MTPFTSEGVVSITVRAAGILALWAKLHLIGSGETLSKTVLFLQSTLPSHVLSSVASHSSLNFLCFSYLKSSVAHSTCIVRILHSLTPFLFPFDSYTLYEHGIVDTSLHHDSISNTPISVLLLYCNSHPHQIREQLCSHPMCIGEWPSLFHNPWYIKTAFIFSTAVPL